MRLYTLTGATQVDDPQFGTFTSDGNGAFDFPNELSDKLHSFHVGGKPAWEDDAQRELRVAREELERFRDPAELLKAVKELGANQGLLTQALAGALGLGAAPPSAPQSADGPGAESSDTAGTGAGGQESADPSPTPAPPSTAKRTRKSAAASTPPAE